jgi:site-specific DNA-adenine methylase
MKIKLSKRQWEFIGKKAGWTKPITAASSFIRPQIGTKSQWFINENTALIKRLLDGVNRVIDAFAGSGSMSDHIRQSGFEGEILFNEFDPKIHSALNKIQNNPSKKDEAINLSIQLSQITDKDEFINVVQGHPDQDIAYLVGYQANFKGRQYPPLNPTLSNYSYLRTFPARLEKWLASQYTLTSDDGFELSSQAGQGDLLLFDPPYIGRDRYQKESPNITESGIDIIRNAINNGAKILCFNA